MSAKTPIFRRLVNGQMPARHSLGAGGSIVNGQMLLTVNLENLSEDLRQIPKRKIDRILRLMQRIRRRIIAILQLEFGAKT